MIKKNVFQTNFLDTWKIRQNLASLKLARSLSKKLLVTLKQKPPIIKEKARHLWLNGLSMFKKRSIHLSWFLILKVFTLQSQSVCSKMICNFQNKISNYNMSLIHQSRKALLISEKIPWLKKIAVKILMSQWHVLVEQKCVS